MRARIRKVLITSAAVLLGGCAYTLLRIKTGFAIPCFFHLLTGLNCPGCGVTRMLISLFKLDFSDAFNYNAGMFCFLPILLLLFAYWLYRYIRYGIKKSPKPIDVACWVIVGILLAWGVVRNIIGM